MPSDMEANDNDRSSARPSSVHLFKGVKSTFPDWSRRFVAACEQKNCADALDAAFVLPADSKAKTTDVDKQKAREAAIKENKMAMSLLNTALVGDALGIFITKTYTTAYPRGVARYVWKGLTKRYQPDGISFTLDFNKELNSINMSRTDDPNKMLDELEALSARYSTLGLTVHEDTFVARALVIARIEYASALTAEKSMKEITNKALTLDDIRSSMDTLFMTNFSDTAKAVTQNSVPNHEIRLSHFNGGRGGRGGRDRGRGR
jgi:hypothetical protein